MLSSNGPPGVLGKRIRDKQRGPVQDRVDEVLREASEREGIEGGNVRAIDDLEQWVAKFDDEATKRFGAQIASARTLAVEIDRGDLSKAHVYRALISDIYTRFDKIHGVETADTIDRLNALIEKHALARAAKGWDER